MSKFSITSNDFKEGEEISKKFGYKFENESPSILLHNVPEDTKIIALIMDDPDAMAAVGKVWVHWLVFDGDLQNFSQGNSYTSGKNDFDEIGYGGPAPPNGKHTYIFKVYALDTELDLKEGYSKHDLEKAMSGHIIAEAKLTGTFAP